MIQTASSISAVLLLLVALLGGVYYMRQRSKEIDDPIVDILDPATTRPRDPLPQPPIEPLSSPPSSGVEDLPPLINPNPMDDYGLLNFSFESRVLGPGYTPDARTKMTRTTAAEDNYKLVRCQFSNGYAIKWSGRYLSLKVDGTVEWNVRKDEPNTCWKIEPGYCGGDGAQYVMLRSLMNNQFLRIDGDTKRLVCVDAPTADNAYQYCWKFQKDDPIRQRCGTYYHPDYQRVVTIPCTIVKDPPPGKGCDSVTPGYMAKCCGRYPNDTSCRSVFLREVVGRGLNEASLYIKTRFPQHQILTCARGDACEHADPFPLYKSDTWILPYDKRLGTVSSPAFRFI